MLILKRAYRAPLYVASRFIITIIFIIIKFQSLSSFAFSYLTIHLTAITDENVTPRDAQLHFTAVFIFNPADLIVSSPPPPPPLKREQIFSFFFFLLHKDVTRVRFFR